jgi:hypothetical protein
MQCCCTPAWELQCRGCLLETKSEGGVVIPWETMVIIVLETKFEAEVVFPWGTMAITAGHNRSHLMTGKNGRDVVPWVLLLTLANTTPQTGA